MMARSKPHFIGLFRSSSRSYIRSFILFVLTLILHNADAQKTFTDNLNIDRLSLGLGVGLDYGGFGANALYCPLKNLGLFTGIGYTLAGAGINAGVKLRYVPGSQKTKLSAFGLFMYGYNAAIVVMNASEHNKLFYGASAGVGLDYRRKHTSPGYWSFALLLPIRNSEVGLYMDELKTKYGIQFENDLLPLGISLGYRFRIY